LEITATQDFGGDTGFLLGLELLKAGVKVEPIKKYPTIPVMYLDDPLAKLKKWHKEKKDMFSDEAKWIHIGNMGNTLPDWFDKGKKNYENEREYKEVTAYRLGWLFEIMSCDSFREIGKYKEQVNREIDNAIKTLNLDFKRIKEYQKLFHKLLWEER